MNEFVLKTDALKKNIDEIAGSINTITAAVDEGAEGVNSTAENTQNLVEDIVNISSKMKVDFGWNREEQYVHWQGKLSVDKGRILSVTPCFRGAAFTSPQEGETEFHTHIAPSASQRPSFTRSFTCSKISGASSFTYS